MSWWRRRPKRPDGWYDLMDPRGDGTLRPGDEMYDAMQRIAPGSAVSGVWDEDRRMWVLREVKLDEDSP